MRFLGRVAKFWLLLALLGTAGYFGYFNRVRIPVTLPPWFDGITVPAVAAYIAFFLFGSFVTTVYLGLESFRKTFEIRRLNRRLRELEPEPSGSLVGTIDRRPAAAKSQAPTPSIDPSVS